MVQILRDNQHPTHSYYCSFDIKSLYTSCSMKLAKCTVIKQFTRNPSLLPAYFSISALDTLINFCLDHSYFEYYGSFYSQTEGGPMGSPVTVALAEVRVSEIESLACPPLQILLPYTSISFKMASLGIVIDSMQKSSYST